MGNSDEVRQRVLRKIEELKRRGLVGTKQPERKEPEEDTLIYKGVHRDFTAVPNIFYHCGKAVSDGELRLWGTLVTYAMNKGHCWPGRKRLCKDMGTSNARLTKLIKGLREKGLIKSERRGLNQTNKYTIFDPKKRFPGWTATSVAIRTATGVAWNKTKREEKEEND